MSRGKSYFRFRIIDLLWFATLVALACLLFRQVGVSGAGMLVGGLLAGEITRAITSRSRWIVAACIGGIIGGAIGGLAIDIMFD